METACGMVVVFLILSIVLNFFPFFMNYQTAADAARQGARAAAEQGSLFQACAAGVSYVQQKLQDDGVLKGSQVHITASPSFAPNNTVTVLVQARIPLLWGGAITVSGSATDLIQPLHPLWPGVGTNQCDTTF